MSVASFCFGSPVSDDGRGLKRLHVGLDNEDHPGSPVSDDGRGLKLKQAIADAVGCAGSPVSDDGRGLKHLPGGAVAGPAGGFARQ